MIDYKLQHAELARLVNNVINSTYIQLLNYISYDFAYAVRNRVRIPVDETTFEIRQNIMVQVTEATHGPE